MGVVIDPIATILIIEEGETLLKLESFHLERDGYKVIGMTSTKNVESYLEKDNINLLLVGRVLPDIEGCEFVSYLRAKGIDIPVMFVTTKDRDEEVEEGYRSGADDYLRKPFNMNEFIYRIKAILKRTYHIEYDRITARDIVMDLNRRKAYVGDKEVSLTKLGFELLAIFIRFKDKALEREYLLKNIWHHHDHTQKRTVNVTINRLKKKIDPEDIKNYIIPIRGIGYKFG